MGTGGKLGADRRTVLRAGAGSLLLFHLSGCDALMSPREAREKGAEFRVLDGAQVTALEAFGETLVPGAREAGLAHFVDANLARPHADCLLTLRYLDILPPYDAFYADGLAALDAVAATMHGREFAALDAAQARAVVAPMLGGGPDGWDGPPPPLFYLAVRSDGADLVYGTTEAFERMGLPYVPHIAPPATW